MSHVGVEGVNNDNYEILPRTRDGKTTTHNRFGWCSAFVVRFKLNKFNVGMLNTSLIIFMIANGNSNLETSSAFFYDWRQKILLLFLFAHCYAFRFGWHWILNFVCKLKLNICSMWCENCRKMVRWMWQTAGGFVDCIKSAYRSGQINLKNASSTQKSSIKRIFVWCQLDMNIGINLHTDFFFSGERKLFVTEEDKTLKMMTIKWWTYVNLEWE